VRCGRRQSREILWVRTPSSAKFHVRVEVLMIKLSFPRSFAIHHLYTSALAILCEPDNLAPVSSKGCMLLLEAVHAVVRPNSAGTRSKSPRTASSTLATRSLLPPVDGKTDATSTGTTKTAPLPHLPLPKKGVKSCAESKRPRQRRSTLNSASHLLPQPPTLPPRLVTDSLSGRHQRQQGARRAPTANLSMRQDPNGEQRRRFQRRTRNLHASSLETR
jgi:hypothetical protein